MRLAIIGAGAFGRQVAHHAKAIDGVSVVGFFDDTMMPGTSFSDAVILGPLTAVLESYARGEFDEVVIAIGYKHMARRHALYEELCNSVPFARVIHPTAWIDPSATIGPGAIIYPRCAIDMQVEIAGNAMLNVGCFVAHDSQIGKSCFLSPGVNVAGFVKVEHSVQLGIGAVVIDNVNIASGVRVAAGAVVVGDIDSPGLYLGVPARRRP